MWIKEASRIAEEETKMFVYLRRVFWEISLSVKNPSPSATLIRRPFDVFSDACERFSEALSFQTTRKFDI